MTKTGIAWEDRRSIGYLAAIYRTVKAVLFTPTDCFSRMNISGGFIEPVSYALILGTFGNIVLRLSAWIFLAVLQMPRKIQLLAFDFKSLLLSPLSSILLILVGSFITHLCLLIVGRKIKPFGATLRVISYSSSTGVLLTIPIFFVNFLVCIAWWLYVEFIGLRQVHDISNTKCALSIILQFLFIGVPSLIISFLFY